jgi:hypothetical protein
MCKAKVVGIRSRSGGLLHYNVTCPEHGQVGSVWMHESAMSLGRKHVTEQLVKLAGNKLNTLFSSAKRRLDDLVLGESPKMTRQSFLDPPLKFMDLPSMSFGFDRSPLTAKKQIIDLTPDKIHAILHNAVPNLPHKLPDGICPTCGCSWFGNKP